MKLSLQGFFSKYEPISKVHYVFLIWMKKDLTYFYFLFDNFYLVCSNIYYHRQTGNEY